MPSGVGISLFLSPSSITSFVSNRIIFGYVNKIRVNFTFLGGNDVLSTYCRCSS